MYVFMNWVYKYKNYLSTNINYKKIHMYLYIYICMYVKYKVVIAQNST